ncbi:hypothetical protein ACSBR1_006184 [Camellia fascicularis]
MTGRKRRLGTTSLVAAVNTPILTWRRRTVMKNLGIRISEKRTSAKKETHRRKQVKVGITTKATSRYGKIGA